MSKYVFFDIECYSNYFLICFKSSKRTKFYQLFEDNEQLDLIEIRRIMENYITIGFNSKNYDLWMVAYFLNGATNLQLKTLSDRLILSKKQAWEAGKEYNINIPYNWKHIDIIGPSPAVGIGLKMYGARMHTRILQDLPLEPDHLIKLSDHTLIREYCLNDVNITIDLYEQIKDRIDLRIQMGKIYNLDLNSKSDAQVAEAILKYSLGIKNYHKPDITDTSYHYIAPSFIKFYSEELIEFQKEVEENEFKCNESGRLVKNATIRKKVKIGDTIFSVGIGGLHSNEKHRATIAKEGEFLIDIDVISYYPTIILNNEYYPKIGGKEFLTIYKKFYEARIEAKKNKDKIKSETYKIILNGSFGKFGSRYSFLYSPSLLLNTTLTGQLSLLMLIEEIILADFKVISSNTDGITILGDKNRFDKLKKILKEWGDITNFRLELTNYRAIYHDSVNSYIAVLADNKIKCKGIFGIDGLSKNPVALVCKEAVIEYLHHKTPIEETIFKNRHDIKKFLIIRKVEGGALYQDQYLGKIVRWYYGLKGDKITYKKNGNKVATSDGAVPLMTLPFTSPADINFDIYRDKAYEMLENLGVKI